jgi:hypothetical protein
MARPSNAVTRPGFLAAATPQVVPVADTSLATTQRQSAPGGSANPGYRSTSAGGQNRSFQSSSYGQLEQDRQARSFGS